MQNSLMMLMISTGNALFGKFSPKHQQFKLKCDACNPGQIILNKIEKFSIIGREKKKFGI